jgi:hypothetical protein
MTCHVKSRLGAARPGRAGPLLVYGLNTSDVNYQWVNSISFIIQANHANKQHKQAISWETTNPRCQRNTIGKKKRQSEVQQGPGLHCSQNMRAARVQSGVYNPGHLSYLVTVWSGGQ